MLTKEELREAILAAKHGNGMTWEDVGEKLGRSAVGAAPRIQYLGPRSRPTLDGGATFCLPRN